MNAATRGGGHRRTCPKQKIRLTQSPDAPLPCKAKMRALGGFLGADKKGGFSARGVHIGVHDPNRKPA